MSANGQRLRAAVRLLYPEEMTPQAKRILLQLADAMDDDDLVPMSERGDDSA